jgi:ABC-type transport system involved in cytochrome bd biosynthesis fused ATPase/permease subunit
VPASANPDTDLVPVTRLFLLTEGLFVNADVPAKTAALFPALAAQISSLGFLNRRDAARFHSRVIAASASLEVENLEVTYGPVIVAVQGVSLKVPSNCIVALLGTNGAGKSTTVRAISGFLPVDDA